MSAGIEGWTPTAWTATVGVVAALLALAVAGPVGYLVFRQPFLVVGAVAGAVLVASASWWLLVERSGTATVTRGLCVGGLTGAAAHPVMWAVWFGAGFGVTGRDTGVLYVLFLGLAGSLYSLVLLGWVTVPLGAAAGALLARVRARSLDGAGGSRA